VAVSSKARPASAPTSSLTDGSDLDSRLKEDGITSPTGTVLLAAGRSRSVVGAARLDASVGGMFARMSGGALTIRPLGERRDLIDVTCGWHVPEFDPGGDFNFWRAVRTQEATFGGVPCALGRVR
jgi:hypothetical protein